MTSFETIKSLIGEHYPDAIQREDLLATPQALIIDSKRIHAVCELLHRHPECYFDQLSCLTGIDNGPDPDNGETAMSDTVASTSAESTVAVSNSAGTMEIAYNLYSIPNHLKLMLKVILDRQNPIIDSVADIWITANWHEREAFDLLGIDFTNHPDLRRILLPKDWEGYPLRKDYTAQELYHGITVRYDRDDEAPQIDDRS